MASPRGGLVVPETGLATAVRVISVSPASLIVGGTVLLVVAGLAGYVLGRQSKRAKIDPKLQEAACKAAEHSA